jgi:hypothetical protein
MKALLTRPNLPEQTVVLAVNSPAALRWRLLARGYRVWWSRPPSDGSTLRQTADELLAVDLRRCLPGAERDEAVARIAMTYQIVDTMYRSWRRVQHASHSLRISDVPGIGDPVLANIRRMTAFRRMLDRSVVGEVHRNLPELAAALDLGGARGRQVGAATVAALARYIVNPLRFRNVRSAWRYAGLGVDGGRAQRRVSGQRTSFSPGLRRALRALVVASWQRRDCYWSDLHKMLLPEYLAKHAAGCSCRSKAHVANMAWREVLRRWLADAWIGWRAGMLRYYDAKGIEVSREWL